MRSGGLANEVRTCSTRQHMGVKHFSLKKREKTKPLTIEIAAYGPELNIEPCRLDGSYGRC